MDKFFTVLKNRKNAISSIFFICDTLYLLLVIILKGGEP